MSERYVILPRTRADLQQIIRYIANDNPGAARKMKSIIMEACARLGEYPHMGQQREDLTTKPVRFWPVHRNYMIIYDAEAAPVRIIRIYNAAMDVMGLLPAR